MGKILTVAMQRGGAGKTTFAVHLAWFAAEKGYRTLLVDLDAQGNATDTVAPQGVGDAPAAAELFGSFDATRTIYAVGEGLSLLPSTTELVAVERAPLEAADVLRHNLRRLAEDYDLIVIDTPLSMGFGMIAPLQASDYAVGPVLLDPFSVKGAFALMGKIGEIRAEPTATLEFLGLLVNKHNRRSSMENELLDELKKNARDFLVPAAIGQAAAIARTANTRQPVWRAARSGAHRQAAKQMRDALSWVLNRALPRTSRRTARAPSVAAAS